MSDRLRIRLQGTKLTENIRFPEYELEPNLPCRLRAHVDALGPSPRKGLAALVDLGLSDHEIGRYHKIPQDCVADLRTLWNIDHPV